MRQCQLIKVTRLDDSELFVNAELVEYVEATPDTVLSLTTNRKLVVKECPEEVIGRIIEYRRRVTTAQWTLP